MSFDLASLTQRGTPSPAYPAEPSVGPLRGVVLHNHPHFLETSLAALAQTDFSRATGLFSFDLNELSAPPGTRHCNASAAICAADLFVVAIDRDYDLPPMWKVVLWLLFKARTSGQGWLVIPEEAAADRELAKFLEDLATVSRLDIVRPANPAGDALDAGIRTPSPERQVRPS